MYVACNFFYFCFFFFFSSRRRHTRSLCDWSSDVCSSDLNITVVLETHDAWPTSVDVLNQLQHVHTRGPGIVRFEDDGDIAPGCICADGVQHLCCGCEQHGMRCSTWQRPTEDAQQRRAQLGSHINHTLCRFCHSRALLRRCLHHPAGSIATCNSYPIGCRDFAQSAAHRHRCIRFDDCSLSQSPLDGVEAITHCRCDGFLDGPSRAGERRIGKSHTTFSFHAIRLVAVGSRHDHLNVTVAPAGSV